MEHKDKQRELFEFEEPKRRFAGFTKILPKPDIEGKIALTLTLDKMIFICIGIIMLMVLIYALGVETGKRQIATKDSARLVKRAAHVKPAKSTLQKAGTFPAAAAQNQTASKKAFLNTVQATSALSNTESNNKNYMIIAATFTKKETAQALVSLLKKDGFSAFVHYSDPYYQVAAGGYDDKNSRQIRNDLSKIRRKYNDAYIKTTSR